MMVFFKNQVLPMVQDMSDRQPGNRSFQQQMQWNQLILDTTMDGFFRFNTQGNILEINPAFAELMQYSPDELLEMKVQDFLARETSQDICKHIQIMYDFQSLNIVEINESGKFPKKSARFKSKYRRGDGQIIDVEITVTVTDLGDELLRFAFVRDISDRVVTARSLFESQRLIQTITDTLPVIIYIYDIIENKTLYLNSQIYESLGYSIEQIQAMKQNNSLVENILHSEDALSETKLLERWSSVEDCEILQTEMRIKTAQGLWRNFQCKETLFLRNPDGLPQQILGMAIDITEQKQTHNKLLHLSKAVKSTSDAIGIADLNGDAIYVNPAFVKLFGYQLSELIADGGPPAVYKDPSVAEAVFSTIKQGGSWSGEVKMHDRDGQLLDILLRTDAIKDESGETIGLIGIHTDISDLKRIQEKLAQHAIELALYNSELEQFTYVASHDLQEPLRVITSYLQLLSRRYLGKVDSQADRYINFVVNAAERMQQLIEDLLEFSQLGNYKTNLVPVECENVLESVLDYLKFKIRRSETKVTYDPLPQVMGDRSQLIQLFQNLIENAIKYSGDCSPAIHISATRLKDDEKNQWCFQITDNGIGIAPEFFERIFSIFKRLHTRQEYPGTGIGLAICKKVVQGHGGKIWVESQPKVGSTFYFTLKAID